MRGLVAMSSPNSYRFTATVWFGACPDRKTGYHFSGACADQPPQPPIVTLICLVSVKNEPSLIFATAMMFCVVARRMRVVASAAPDSAVKLKVATPAFGLP